MLLDANILLYARNADDPHHGRARAWLVGALNGQTRVGFPWQTVAAFLRIATNPRAFVAPLEPEVAWQQVEDWLAAPRAWVPQPTAAYASVLGRLVRSQPGPWTVGARCGARRTRTVNLDNRPALHLGQELVRLGSLHCSSVRMVTCTGRCSCRSARSAASYADTRSGAPMIRTSTSRGSCPLTPVYRAAHDPKMNRWCTPPRSANSSLTMASGPNARRSSSRKGS
ncbi:MAG: TA system VapC family ribonuclease toxin [Egibacteraceae bacterium]